MLPSYLMSEPLPPPVPESPYDRAGERISDAAPVEILRGPTTGRTVKGPVGHQVPDQIDGAEQQQGVPGS